ncbi:MAG: tRNA (guanine(46)-N(7))-methyltransferase TrmB [Pseudomonadota bacterium]
MLPFDARAHFGRKKGHGTRAGQVSRLNRMLPAFALDLTAPSPRSLTALFREPVEAVRLEIGFGSGEHLLHQVRSNPRIGFIGCEAFEGGVAKLLGAAEEDPPGNLRLHFGDALEVLDWLPAGELSRIDLLYPDPWPKRRHWKRRFVNAERTQHLAVLLRPGGHFRFASDISSNITWTLMQVGHNAAFRWIAQSAGDWQTPWADWHRTRYEKKAIREGRRPAYLTFERL